MGMKRLLLALALSGLSFVPAAADDPPSSWGLRPADGLRSYFEIAAVPGQVITDRVAIVNQTPNAVMLEVLALGPAAEQAGGFGVAATASGAALWLDPSALTLTVPAQHVEEVEIVIRVPDGTPPGVYDAALVARLPASESAGEHVAIRIVRQAAVAVIVTVGQPDAGACALSVDSLSAGYGLAGDFAFNLDATNVAPVPWRGAASLALRPAAGGEPVARLDLPIGRVHAFGGLLRLALGVDAPPAGDYILDASLTSPGCTAVGSSAVTVTVGDESAAGSARRGVWTADAFAWLGSHATLILILALAGIGAALVGLAGLMAWRARVRGGGL
jgi:hypothetical protein